MLTLKENMAFISIMALLFLSCNEIEQKRQLKNKILKIDNLIIEELTKQDFYFIKTSVKNNAYHIDAEINGHQLSMIVDTGATFSILKSEYCDDYKLEKIVTSNKRKLKSKPIFNDLIEIFPVKAESFKIGDIEFNPWPFMASKEITCKPLLGTEFLHQTKAIIICNASVLCITINKNPANNLYNILKKYSYKEIDLIEAKSLIYNNIHTQYGDNYESFKSGIFFVPVIFNEICGYASIDTGSAYTMIDSTKFEHEMAKTRTYFNFTTSDIKGTKRKLKTLTLNKLIIDNHNLSDHFTVEFVKMENKDFIIDNKYIVKLGIIGLDILVKYNAVIDFGNHKLYLQI